MSPNRRDGRGRGHGPLPATDEDGDRDRTDERRSGQTTERGRTRTRRTLLTGVAGGSLLLAGCSVSVGTPDLTVRNCLEETRPVSVAVTAPSGEVVYDRRHEVPGETCVDLKEAPVAVEDLIAEPGTYRVAADAPGVESVEGRRTFERNVVEDDLDSIGITLDERGLRL